MVDGVQSRSLAQAAAATLKLLRSAHKRTLPAKNTTTVTGQLIGRSSARSGLAEAISVLAGMTFSRHFCLVAIAGGACLSHLRYHAPSITGRVSAEGCAVLIRPPPSAHYPRCPH